MVTGLGWLCTFFISTQCVTLCNSDLSIIWTLYELTCSKCGLWSIPNPFKHKVHVLWKMSQTFTCKLMNFCFVPFLPWRLTVRWILSNSRQFYLNSVLCQMTEILIAVFIWCLFVFLIVKVTVIHVQFVFFLCLSNTSWSNRPIHYLSTDVLIPKIIITTMTSGLTIKDLLLPVLIVALNSCK